MLSFIIDLFLYCAYSCKKHGHFYNFVEFEDEFTNEIWFKCIMCSHAHYYKINNAMPYIYPERFWNAAIADFKSYLDYYRSCGINMRYNWLLAECHQRYDKLKLFMKNRVRGLQ